jgi:hypothetical protein
MALSRQIFPDQRAAPLPDSVTWERGLIPPKRFAEFDFFDVIGFGVAPVQQRVERRAQQETRPSPKIDLRVPGTGLGWLAGAVGFWSKFTGN